MIDQAGAGVKERVRDGRRGVVKVEDPGREEERKRKRE